MQIFKRNLFGVLSSFVFALGCFFLTISPVSAQLACGQTFDPREVDSASCPSTCSVDILRPMTDGKTCCGWLNNSANKCFAAAVEYGNFVSNSNTLCVRNLITLTGEKTLVPLAASPMFCCGYLNGTSCVKEEPVVPIPSICRLNRDLDNGQCGSKAGCPPNHKCIWLLGSGECEERTKECRGNAQCGQTGTLGQCGYENGCLDGEVCREPSASDAIRCSNGELAFCGPKCVGSTDCPAVIPGVCDGGSGSAYKCGIAGGCSIGSYCDPFSKSCISAPSTCGAKPPVDPGDPERDPTLPPTPTPPPFDDSGNTGGGIDIFKGPNAENFKQLNPFRLLNVGADIERSFSSPGGIITRTLAFLWPLAGLALFFMLVWGGFEILSKANDAKAMEAGKQRITMAILGFVLLFASFWIVQIISWIFGLSIL